jgi:diguanylate cyclase (GGDEF)-like protein
MKKKLSQMLNLRLLIVAFALLMTLLTLVNSFYSAWRVQKQVLIANELSENQAYAERVASTIDLYLSVCLERLEYSAGVIGRHFNDPQVIQDELVRMQRRDFGFDSVTLADTKGQVIGVLPESLNLKGKVLTTPGGTEALREMQPTVSSAYSSLSGNLVVYISHPVRDSQGQYLGFIGGAIYLQKSNVLSALITNHFRSDDSYVYVVDKNDQLLYHPDPARRGEKEEGNAVVETVEQGKSGSMEVTNSRGVEMLAGYAGIPSSGWGVVVQKPKTKTLSALDGLMWQMTRGIVPLGIVGLVILWWLGSEIVRPLRQLADHAVSMDSDESAEKVRSVRSWYIEASRLRRALLQGMELIREKMKWLNDQASTDPLTSLVNRRAAEKLLVEYEHQHREFAVISLDIDHFKAVNDTFGHDIGDVTLKELARLLKRSCRKNDTACRMGGEEFMMLFPDTPLDAATDIAERLRKEVAASEIETVGHITISLGVTVWPAGPDSVSRVLKRADELMYQAKQGGRNRVVAG